MSWEPLEFVVGHERPTMHSVAIDRPLSLGGLRGHQTKRLFVRSFVRSFVRFVVCWFEQAAYDSQSFARLLVCLLARVIVIDWYSP